MLGGVIIICTNTDCILKCESKNSVERTYTYSIKGREQSHTCSPFINLHYTLDPVYTAENVTLYFSSLHDSIFSYGCSTFTRVALPLFLNYLVFHMFCLKLNKWTKKKLFRTFGKDCFITEMKENFAFKFNSVKLIVECKVLAKKEKS